MSFLQIAIPAGGLAILVLVLVEGAGLLRSVRRCSVATEWKEAIRALKRRPPRAVPDSAPPVGSSSIGGSVVDGEQEVADSWENARQAAAAVHTEVKRQAGELRKKRKKLIDAATEIVKDFRHRLPDAILMMVSNGGMMAIAGSLLFMVLASIHILYYSYFDFNVIEYLPGYSLPAIMLSLLQVLVLLLLVSLFLVFAFVFILPRAVFQLARICYGTRAAVAKALANSFFTACYYSMTCSRLASPLLYGTPAAPTKSVSSVAQPDETPPVPASKRTGGAEADSRERIVDPAMSLLLLFLFACACAVFIWFEPQYRAYATCHGTRSTRVVIDPPLRDTTRFTKIGQIGEHVFLAPFDACGRRASRAPRNGGADGSEGRMPESAGDESGTAPAGASETAEDRAETADGVGTEGNGAQPGGSLNVLGGYQYVFDSIQDRLRFLRDDLIPSRLDESQEQSAGVTVVPVNRVLCMYEDHEDLPGRSAACDPPPRSPVDAVGVPIIYQGTDNTWVIVAPPEVRIRMDDEWRVKEEIARRLCNGGEAVVSEPVVFERGESTPAHAQRAQAAMAAFLNEPELRGVRLYVLGFASGDGNRRYNEDLAARRAEAVAAEVKKLDGDRMLEEVSWGENHLTNGVASSRSVRLVGCRPVSEAAGGVSESFGRAVASALAVWPEDRPQDVSAMTTTGRRNRNRQPRNRKGTDK